MGIQNLPAPASVPPGLTFPFTRLRAPSGATHRSFRNTEVLPISCPRRSDPPQIDDPARKKSPLSSTLPLSCRYGMIILVAKPGDATPPKKFIYAGGKNQRKRISGEEQPRKGLPGERTWSSLLPASSGTRRLLRPWRPLSSRISSATDPPATPSASGRPAAGPGKKPCPRLSSWRRPCTARGSIDMPRTAPLTSTQTRTLPRTRAWKGNRRRKVEGFRNRS
jgi:hypothetical protein